MREPELLLLLPAWGLQAPYFISLCLGFPTYGMEIMTKLCYRAF